MGACPAEAAHEASEAIVALKNMCEQLQDQVETVSADASRGNTASRNVIGVFSLTM